MLTISIHKPVVLRYSHVTIRSQQKFHKIDAAPFMTTEEKSSHTRKMEELSVKLPTPFIPHLEPPEQPDLQFDRLQPSDRDLVQEKKFESGRFIAREAMLDEEYWTAAWLRAESLWEDRSNDRFADNRKRQFAEQEFNALKRRRQGVIGQKCSCIVTVKKEKKNVKRTVLKSLVGTLDLSIRYLLDGETFPGEWEKPPPFCSLKRTESNRYAYISNLCVAKAARRQSIASNMMHFAIRSAVSDGAEQVYVHVHRENGPAQVLYRKMGFEIVERATAQLEVEKTYLLCLKTT